MSFSNLYYCPKSNSLCEAECNLAIWKTKYHWSLKLDKFWIDQSQLRVSTIELRMFRVISTPSSDVIKLWMAYWIVCRKEASISLTFVTALRYDVTISSLIIWCGRMHKSLWKNKIIGILFMVSSLWIDSGSCTRSLKVTLARISRSLRQTCLETVVKTSRIWFFL